MKSDRSTGSRFKTSNHAFVLLHMKAQFLGELPTIFLYLLSFIALLVDRTFSLTANSSEEETTIYLQRYPYIVSIRNFGRYDCTGVVIGSKAVLTAAQCVDPRYDRSPMPEVWLNSSTSRYPSETALFRRVVNVSMHPLYTGDAFNGYDIAVLLLNETTESKERNASIRAIRYGKDNELKIHQSLSILDYGRSSSTGAVSTVLLVGDVEVIEPEVCMNTEDTGFLPGKTVCVQGTVPCNDYPGGPMFINTGNPWLDTLVGIVSVSSCSENRRISAIQDITDNDIVDWVTTQVKEWGAGYINPCPMSQTEFGLSIKDLTAEEQGEKWTEYTLLCVKG